MTIHRSRSTAIRVQFVLGLLLEEMTIPVIQGIKVPDLRTLFYDRLKEEEGFTLSLISSSNTNAIVVLGLIYG